MPSVTRRSLSHRPKRVSTWTPWTARLIRNWRERIRNSSQPVFQLNENELETARTQVRDGDDLSVARHIRQNRIGTGSNSGTRGRVLYHRLQLHCLQRPL